MTNTTAVVSHEWGCTLLLGVNCLKIAYGGACNKAIRELGLAGWQLPQEIHLTVDYHFSGLLEYELQNRNWIKLEDINYAERVSYICTLDLENVNPFINETTDLLNGHKENM